MDRLPPDRFPEVASLFHDGCPNAAMLHATLEGRVPGIVIVDNASQPTCALLQTEYYSFTFPSHPIPPTFLNQGLNHLLNDRPVMLVWDPQHADQPPPEAQKTLERKQLTGFDISSQPHEDIQVPVGAMLSPMDSGIIPKCSWHEQLVHAMGSIERFLTYGLGVCLIKNDEILAEAYMCFWGNGQAEIGVVTHEDHRNRGFGALTARHLIELCEERGLDAYITCYTQNRTLIKLARRIGLDHQRTYQLHLYGSDLANEIDDLTRHQP
ncbi:GNAT family N-acetyltransferase [Mucisphaera calidilacus]|uniref:GNAT acetyltransferase n=1 Tax=Mucisphaera calidilacus TaxID=2527982 RepID=A0A518BYQ8_9BACT|nr:GNAT family N-acetyltransferase [Mucisphaera calidilacus]QDU72112.1 GNAT acetyltransferase [Mucisphaera calidilacus]